ncbi:hypothetical protein MNBD_GAMMA12-382 [hydrothermal vent metagenome]|uniref:Lipoprotein n=1 Tax=hydrothermal vent metagenome TaxID=652676 RepID=A0A3B0YQV9_9ZZZZ
MENKLFRVLLPILILGSLSGCSSVSQKDLTSRIIGTWACQNDNIALSGITFHRELMLSSYRTGTLDSKTIDRTDHFATGYYRIRKNIIISKVKYQAPLLALSVEMEISKKISVPKEEVTHTFVVSSISSHSLSMDHIASHSLSTDQHYDTLTRGKMRCKKVTEPTIGHHYDQFLSKLEEKKTQARKRYAKLVALRKSVLLRKTIANNINLIRDASYYRGILANLLPITSETIPQKLRITSIVGQDLNYQFSGITDSDKVVEKFVQALKKRPELDSVQVSENRAFNIISKHDNKKLSQTLYEFRVSISFKPSVYKYAFSEKIPVNLNKSKEHQQANIKLTRDFNTEARILVKNSHISSLLKKLRRTALISKVKFKIFQPHDDQIQTAQLVQLSTTVSIKGQYKSLAMFLTKIAAYKKLVALSGMQIEPESYDNMSNNLIMSGYLTFYGTHPTGAKLIVKRHSRLYPTKPSRRRIRVKRTAEPTLALRDPFNSYNVESKYIVRYKPGCRHLDTKLLISGLKYVGRIKKEKGYTALLKGPNTSIMKVKEGHCIARSVSVSKIMRDKIVLRQDFKLRNGRWSPRTITLHAVDK